MANTLTGNTWRIDTATITREPITIVGMVYKPAATSNDLTITDGNGDMLWDVDALAATPAGDQIYDQAEKVRKNGFIVTVIDGGVLWVEVE